jgi:hypothetical protein
MPTPERLADQVEEHRAHLRAVAGLMLGSASEVDESAATFVPPLDTLRKVDTRWMTLSLLVDCPRHI